MIDRLFNLIAFGRVSLVDDSGDFQLVQMIRRATGTGGGSRLTDRLRRISQFGFTSVPPVDADLVVINRNGDSAHGIAIASAHRASRPRGLKEGDTAIHDVRGRIIRLTADGIEVDGAGGPVTVTNASKVRCDCDIEATGDIVARVDGKAVSLSKLHDVFNQHIHPPVAAGAAWGSGPPKPQA